MFELCVAVAVNDEHDGVADAADIITEQGTSGTIQNSSNNLSKRLKYLVTNSLCSVNSELIMERKHEDIVDLLVRCLIEAWLTNSEEDNNNSCREGRRNGVQKMRLTLERVYLQLGVHREVGVSWCRRQDLNLRSTTQRILSLPLTTRVHLHNSRVALPS